MSFGNNLRAGSALRLRTSCSVMNRTQPLKITLCKILALSLRGLTVPSVDTLGTSNLTTRDKVRISHIGTFVFIDGIQDLY